MSDVVEIFEKKRESFAKFKTDLDKINLKKLLDLSPTWQSQLGFRSNQDLRPPQFDIIVQMVNLVPTIIFPIDVQEYFQCLQLAEQFIVEIVSILRQHEYQIFDCYSGINGQVQSMKTALGVKVLYLENDSQEDKINDKPIVIGVDPRYDENTISLLGLCVTLSSRSALQMIEGSSMLSPVEIVSLTYMAANSYRAFVFAYPELLKDAALWWLIQTIPARQLTQNNRMRDDLFQSYASVSQLVPNTFTMPIKGQLVFISRLQKRYANCSCQCMCSNQLCIRNTVNVEEEYCEKISGVQVPNLLQQLFIDRSIFIDLLCSQGSCAYYNDDSFQQSTFNTTAQQNLQILKFLQKHYTIKTQISNQQIKSEIELTELSMMDREGFVTPARAARIQGLFLIVQNGIGLVDAYNSPELSLSFSLNNTRCYASSMLCLHQLQASDLIKERSLFLYYGTLANNLESTVKKRMSELQATAAAFLFLAAQPLCYENLQKLVFLDVQRSYPELKQKKQVNVNILQLLQYLQDLDSGKIQDQLQFRLDSSMFYKIFLTKPTQLVMNSKAENEQQNTKLIQQFCILFKSFVQPFTQLICSSHQENIARLQNLFKFYFSNHIWQTTQQEVISVNFDEKQKDKIEIDSQKQISCYQQPHPTIPKYLQFYNSDQQVKLSINGFGQVQYNDQCLKNMNVKLFARFSGDNDEEMMLAALNLDCVFPKAVQTTKFQFDEISSALSQVILNQVQMSCDVVQQTYDLLQRLLLKVLSKRFSSQQIQQSAQYVNPFTNECIDLSVQNFKDLCLYISSTMQHQFLVPIKPTDFYVYCHSQKLMFHAKEIIGRTGFKPDLFIAIPDILAISFNTIRFGNITNIFEREDEIFKRLYGPLYWNLVKRVIDLYQQNSKDMQSFQFISDEQIRQVILKKITPKLFWANSNAQISTKMTATFFKNIEISDKDASLPYNLPIIMTTNVTLSSYQEDFNVQKVKLSDTSSISEEYVQNRFLKYFQYLLGYENDLALEWVTQFTNLLKHICQINCLLLDVVIKILICWCGIVKNAFVDSEFSRSKLDEISSQIAKSFYGLLCIMFDYNLQEFDFEVLNGLLLKHIIKQKPFSDLFVQGAFNFFEFEQLQSPQMWLISTKLMLVIICFMCNIDIILESISDVDFLQSILQINIEKQMISSFSCDSCIKGTVNIKHQMYYADILKNLKHLVPKTSFMYSMKVDIPNVQMCAKCIMKLQEQIDVKIYIKSFDSNILKSVSVLKDIQSRLSLPNIKNECQYVIEHKIDDNIILDLHDQQKKIETIQTLMSSSTKKIPLEDPFSVLHHVWKHQAQIVPRGQGTFQPFTAIQTLYILDKNKSQTQGFDVLAEVKKMNDPLLTEALFIAMKQLDFYVLRHFIEPNQPESYECSIGREGVYKCLLKLGEYLRGLPIFQFNDILKLVNAKQTWTGEVFSNQYSKFVIGSKLTVLWFSQEFGDETQKYILNEVHNNLFKTDLKWNLAYSLAQVNKTGQNYCCQVQLHTQSMLETVLENLVTYQPNLVCLLVFSNQQLNIDTYLQLIGKICVYQTRIDDNYTFSFKEMLTRQQITKWELYDQQTWRNLVYTHSHIFKQIGKVQFLSNKNYSQQQIDSVQDRIILCKVDFDTVFNKLDEIFTQWFVEHFKNFAQTVQASPDVSQWRLIYGGINYLLNAEVKNIQQLLQMKQEALLQISKTYLKFRHLNILYDQMQQLNIVTKAQIEGLDNKPNRLIIPYINGAKQITQSLNTQLMSLDKTSQIPQLLPQSQIAFQFCEFLNSDKTLWVDVKQDEFDLFTFFYFVSGRVYEAEQLMQYIMFANDQRLEKQKIQIFLDIFSNFQLKLLKLDKKNQQLQVKYMMQNNELFELVAQTIHSVFKSDLQHYVQNFLYQQAIQYQPHEILVHLRGQLKQLTTDCFDKNLSHCIFFVRLALRIENTFDADFWLQLTFYHLCFRYNPQITLELACVQPKDQRLLLTFKQLKSKFTQTPVQSVIIDIFSIEQVRQNQYVLQNLVRHYLICSKYNDNQDLAVRELAFMLKQPAVDHNACLQVFKKQYPEYQIFDPQIVLATKFSAIFQINSMNVFNVIMKWYYNFIIEHYMNQKTQQQVEVIRLQLSLRNQKFSIPTDMKQLNENQPKQQELQNEISLQKQMCLVIEQLLGHLIAIHFNSGNQIRFLQDQLRPNDTIQHNFFDQLKKITPNAGKLVLQSQECENLFKLVFNQAKQSELNVLQEMPRWATSHSINSAPYYSGQSGGNFAASFSAQSFMGDKNQQQIPIAVRKYLDDCDKKSSEQHQKRLLIVQKTEDPIIKAVLTATEQFLIDTCAIQSIYSLLSVNHDECLGLWLPGHVFESRLGIVHADCGLKDSRFEKIDAAAVKVRSLDNIAVRFSWMLAFSCVYLSLRTNEITMQTSKENSILSDEELLGVQRDIYCIGVLQTCCSIVQQAQCCYLHEVVVQFQQFLANLAQLMRKGGQFVPRTCDQRDAFEQLIQEAVQASDFAEIARRNETKTGQVVQPKAQIVVKQEDYLQQLTRLTFEPHFGASLFNAYQCAVVLQQELLKAVSDGSLQPMEPLKDEKQVALLKRFISHYKQLIGKFTISGGCQENELPELSEDIAAQQLVRFQEQAESDFCVVDEFVKAAGDVLQGYPIPKGMGVVELAPQAWLL